MSGHTSTLSITKSEHSSNKEEEDSHSSIETQQEDVSELNWRSGVALAGSALGYFCTVGLINAYGVFQQYYTAHYLPTYSNFDISWIGSFGNFCLFGFGPVGGMIVDRWGPTIPIVVGSVLEVLALFMVALCREYYQFFLAQGMLLGIGMSLVVVATATIVPMYFDKHRGLAQGVSIAGSSIGGVIWPIAMDQMLNKDGLSFAWTMRIVAFMNIPLLALVVVLARPPPRTGSRPTAQPSETQDTAIAPKKDYSSLKRPVFICLCIGLGLAYFGYYAPVFYVSVYAVHIGLKESLAFYLVSVLNGASLFGRVLPGILADHYLGHYTTLTVSMLISGIVVFCWTSATSTAGLFIWTAAYGFTSGAILSMQLTCATMLVPEEMKGLALGAIMASVSLTGLFGAPVAGKLVDRGYGSLEGFAGAMLIGGFVFAGTARLLRNKKLLAKV